MSFYKVRFAQPPNRKALSDFLVDHDGAIQKLDKRDATALVEFLDDPQFPVDTAWVEELFTEFEGPRALTVRQTTIPMEKYVEPPIKVANKIAVNLGAGMERLPGFRRLDMPPKEQMYNYDTTVYPAATITAENLTPDIIAELPNLPFPDGSVDVFRMRDVLIYLDLEDRKQLGRELRRCLKPGGTFIAIEHTGDERAFSRYLTIKSVERAGKVHYGTGFFWRTVYQKGGIT